MSRRLIFSGGVPANPENHYVPGSGVGGTNRAVRRALRRRAANTCCNGNSNDQLCPFDPQRWVGNDVSVGASPNLMSNLYYANLSINNEQEVGLWLEYAKKKVGMSLGDLVKKVLTAPDSSPKLIINRLVIRLQATGRDKPGVDQPADSEAYANALTGENGNFYLSHQDEAIPDEKDSLIKLINQGTLPLTIQEIWILPYQDFESGFDKKNGKTGNDLFFQDMRKAADFIQAWKTQVSTKCPPGWADKIKGMVFETEGTTMASPGTAVSWGAIINELKKATGAFAGINLEWGLTGANSIGNLTAHDYSIFTRLFPQYYNVGDGDLCVLVEKNQDQTNTNFTTSTLIQPYTLKENYTRMYSVEPACVHTKCPVQKCRVCCDDKGDTVPAPGKCGYWGNINWGLCKGPSLAVLMTYITEAKKAKGGHMIFFPTEFWQDKQHQYPASILS